MDGSEAKDLPVENLLASDCPRFAFLFDGAHLRRHWAEMVAVHLPNLRMSRAGALVLGAVAVFSLLPMGGLPPWLRIPFDFGVLALCFSLSLGGSYLWKRHLWLRAAKHHPRFGQELVFLVSQQGIIQYPLPAGVAGAPGLIEIRESPKGYLVRVPLREGHGLGPEFAQTASVYLPQASLRPSMIRPDFLALVDAD